MKDFIKKITRRSFLGYLFGTSLLAWIISVVYPVIKFLAPPRIAEALPTSVVAAEEGELEPNSGKIFRFGNQPAILINTPTGELKAFSAVCTHLQCTVQYRSDFEHIWCACHNGHYDLNGINVAGPPPRPLEPYAVHVKNGKIFVSKENKV
ncbi:MAG: ubiquinol-cytochrome c reductase iron-sulfur subunit [Fidelibacterota bacterium]